MSNYGISCVKILSSDCKGRKYEPGGGNSAYHAADTFQADKRFGRGAWKKAL